MNNKLTEIKESYESYKRVFKNSTTYTVMSVTINLSDLGYLLSLIEEKDKALAFYADIENYDFHGRYSIPMFNDNGDIARKALNTSSNNKGEI